MNQQIVILPLDATPSRGALAIVGEIMTYARLPIGLGAASLILAGGWRAAAFCVAMFVVLDIADGRFARAGARADTARRRGADAVIDKLSVHLCAMAVCTQIPMAIGYWIPLLARDLIQGHASFRMIVRCRVVAAGAPWHRMFSLSMAIWGCAVLLSGQVRGELAVISMVLGYVSLVDYVAQCRAFEASNRLATMRIAS